MVHGGMDLSEALRTIKLDLLFWTREVYKRVNKQTVKNLQTKGKGKAKAASRPLTTPWQPQWTKPRKGDSKGKGTSKGTTLGKGKTSKGKQKPAGKPDWPSHWAFKNPKNVAYCRDFNSPLQDLHRPVWQIPQLPSPGWRMDLRCTPWHTLL